MLLIFNKRRNLLMGMGRGREGFHADMLIKIEVAAGQIVIRTA